MSETEVLYFKRIFEKFYTPDDEYSKFNVKLISYASIVTDKYGKKCFSICVDNIWYPTSIKKLSGANRSEKSNIKRALRNAIEGQINNYRTSYPLDENEICPITNQKLGFNAQVDHKVPFHILAEKWLKYNENISYAYDLNNFEYILQEPYYTSWYKFHFENAILRWVSKEGNKYAHHLYSGEMCN